MRRPLFAAFAVATFLLATAVPTVLAECSSSWAPIGRTERLDVAYAFTARVTEVSREDDPEKSSQATWSVELAIERTYRGRVPDRLVFNGWNVGCHLFRGNGLRTGDRIFVAAQKIHFKHLPNEPFDGDLVIWKRTGDGWRFYEAPLERGSFKEFYPTAVRTARTTAAILQLVYANPAPDTSTLSGDRDESPASALPLLALAFIAGVLLGFKRVLSTAPAPTLRD